jgi:hypothetical protein
LPTFAGNLSTANDRRVIAEFLRAADAGAVLPAYKVMTDTNAAEKHYIHCHASFSNNTNYNTACIIPYAFDSESVMSQGIYKSECCDGSVFLKEGGTGNEEWLNLHETGCCFIGKYTTDISKVIRKYNDVNFLPYKIFSQPSECVRKWVHADDLVFSWQFYDYD